MKNNISSRLCRLSLFALLLPAVAQAQYDYITNNGTITIIKYTGYDSAVIIPDTIDGLPVANIERAAFWGYEGLTSVTIPDSVINIGEFAFASCTSLTNVTIGNGVTKIWWNAFDSCTSLTSVIIPDSVIIIDDLVFWCCTSLTNVTIGNGVTKIGNGAFGACTSLASVTISDSVIGIGHDAFSFCANLTNVTIGNGVIDIGEQAFALCTSLTNLTIGKSVTSIGNYAFLGCTSLASVTIPDSVIIIYNDAFRTCISLTNLTIGKGIAAIGGYAFIDCRSLTGVYFHGNAPRIGSFAFGGGNFATVNATVYYLAGTMGWGPTFGGRPTMLWSPQAQISEAGFNVVRNQFWFTITGHSGLAIVVEACTNLANSVWFPVGTNTLTNGSSYFSDPQTNYSARFYRLRFSP